MNLFASAGVDLPSTSFGRRRQSQRPPRLPLFARKVVESKIERTAFHPTEEQEKIAKAYAKLVLSPSFSAQKETQVRQLFYDRILVGLLGYRQYGGEHAYSLAFEEQVRRGKVDAALGEFSPDRAANRIIAPLEMKGPDTADLDRIMPGRAKSPVQQAWEYAVDVPGAKWVLVSNCIEIRLYGFGRGRDAYELFDLSRLDEPGELRRLLLILGANRFLGSETEALLTETDAALKDVTNELYSDYAALRRELLTFLTDSADGPKLTRGSAIETAQKLLDRILFIAFGGANQLLPGNLLKRASETVNDFNPEPIWSNFRSLFRSVDKGNSRLDIWEYNGGLFAYDPVADTVELPEHLAKDLAALGKWDFASEVPVTVLGHIFEQSITDLEKLREGLGVEEDTVSRRKRDGVVYTPESVTRFLVERTIGETLSERFSALLMERTGQGTFPEDEESSPFPDSETERKFWSAYLEILRALTIVDPACGSGAFLVAAFDALAAEYRRVIERLADFKVKPGFDIYDEILTKNLYGVDLNVESVEITRLSLWLKTARRQYRLQSLDENIDSGNSVIHDSKATDRPFDWQAAFPGVFAEGGFDIVIGNPPYVRMELLKPVKPWLAEHYAVADERTDLYAYFFEKGLQVLKPGGRLGFISSSTFFRTGSGQKLRLHLAERMDLETVIDFGDVQMFEGVTTYAAILVGRKREMMTGPGGGNLRFWNVSELPSGELAAAFEVHAQSMPRARLTGGSWQFENTALAALRDKIISGRKTLGEVYGAPLYGIKTGLNDAFVIDTQTHDRLISADPNSADLLKPFLKGENVKRWRVEPEGLWLINTPKGKVDIEAYPAIRDWLLPFKDRLEARATKQEWWELQQAQLAYQEKMSEAKISYPHFQNQRMFTLERTGFYSNDKTYFLPGNLALLGYLNSTLAWFFFTSVSPAVRNHWYEMRVQYVETLPVPMELDLGSVASFCTDAAASRLAAREAFLTRLPDLGGLAVKPSGKLEDFHELTFSELMAEIKRVFRVEIPLKDRAQWEAFHAAQSAEIKRLTSNIATAERDIDRLVYQAFDLMPEEIALLEASIAR